MPAPRPETSSLPRTAAVGALSSAPVDRLAIEYTEALLDESAHPASSIAVLRRAVETGFPIATLHVDVIPAAMNEVGRRWEQGRISVAAEHLATSAVQAGLRELARGLQRQERNRRIAIVAAVDGELHDLGPRILADLLDADGWDVVYVGASTPTAALVSLVAQRRADAVLLSATMPDRVETLVDAVDRIRASVPLAPRIVAGGQACTSLGGARHIGADAVLQRADRAVEWLRPLQRSIDITPLVETLTEREQDVLALLSTGLTNQEIADRLSISLATAKTHVAHILRKLDLRNRSEAAALATKRSVSGESFAARVL